MKKDKKTKKPRRTLIRVFKVKVPKNLFPGGYINLVC